MNISAVIIAKNEENTIEDCISLLAFCDEILVVDSGSTDKTVEIANKMHATVVTKKTDDFAKLRNFGLQKAKHEWILYVDADERVTEELAKNIKKAMQEDVEYTAFRIQRKNFYFGNSEWPYVEKLERLFLKEKLKKWRGILHESPVVDGKIGELQGFLYHFTHRDLSSMLEKTIIWSEKEARLRYDAKHPQ